MPEQRERTKDEALEELKDKLTALCNARQANGKAREEANHQAQLAKQWADNAKKLESEVEDLVAQLTVEGWLSVLPSLNPDDEIVLTPAPWHSAQAVERAPAGEVQFDAQNQRVAGDQDSGIDLAKAFEEDTADEK